MITTIDEVAAESVPGNRSESRQRKIEILRAVTELKRGRSIMRYLMIGTEPRGQTLAGDGMVEHAAERWPIDGNGLHPKTDDPASKLIHDDQNPVTPQQDRFGPEQVQAPEMLRAAVPS